jgi:hypothetical protein
MSKHFLGFVVAMVTSALLGGCLVHTTDGYGGGGYGGGRRSSAARPACHPSQYWDGSMCRHKGRGHGARKHDGR